MASVVTAGIALVRRIQSASNMSLAGSERIDIEHGHDPGPTVSLRDMNPTSMRNRIGRRSSFNGSTNDNIGSVEVSESPAIDTFEGLSDQAVTPPRTRTTTWSSLFGSSKPVNQEEEAKAQEQIAGRKYVQEEHDKCESRRINDYPRGLSNLAALQCSSDDLAIFRLFKHSHTRTLLRLELEITEIEERLFELELSFVGDPNNQHQLTSTTSKDGENKNYKQDLQQLKEKIKEYGDIALNYAQLHALGKPQERNHRSLFNHIVSTKPLAAENRKFVYARNEFFRVKNCSTNYFDESVQHYFGGNQNSFFKRFVETKKETPLNTDPLVKYYSSSRLQNIIKTFSVCVAVGVLLTPVYLLFLVPMARGLMALTASMFLVLFAGIMTFLTEAKLDLIFVGTATYGAVLIMFLGNLNEAGKGFSP